MTKPTIWLWAQRRLRSAWALSYPLSAQRRCWSDWADAKAELSLRWVHTHFVGFVTGRLKSGFFDSCFKDRFFSDQCSVLLNNILEIGFLMSHHAWFHAAGWHDVHVSYPWQWWAAVCLVIQHDSLYSALCKRRITNALISRHVHI